MQLLLIHSDHFSWEAKDKALKDISDITEKFFSTKDSILVVFVSVEQSDEGSPAIISKKAVLAIIESANDIKEKNIMIYPFVHLITENPGKPQVARNILSKMLKGFEKKTEFTVYSSPFGYYKAFTLANKGHPLAERSKRITIDSVVEKEVPTDDEYSDKEDLTAIKAEEQSSAEFFILTQKGDLIKTSDYRFPKKEKQFKKFIKYETNKDRTSLEPPPHIALMKQLELVDYEQGTDPGNFRILPRGLVIKNAIEEYTKQMLIDYGAHIIESPLFYDFEHPALKKYLNRFPARQYVVESGHKNYFMRFSACFGQFLTLSQSTISYKNLPVKIFELAKSFRREQSGEISGLRRLRGFTMPDIHTVCSDIPMSKKAFREQYEMSLQMMNELELDIEVAFRVQKNFFDEHKDWILDMVKLSKKNCLLEIYEERYAYFILKFEFNFVDTQGKAAALSTVQIDVENGERFEIRYVDESGKEQYPYILHCSIPGSVERDIYALLEKASAQINKKEIPILPFWVSPVHTRLIPIGEKHLGYCQQLRKSLESINVRVEIDNRLGERVAKRIRAAELLWIPMLLVIGDKELDSNELTIRERGTEEYQKSKHDFVSELGRKLDRYPSIRLNHPPKLSDQIIFSRKQ
ncbi:MAG: Threonine--tRNA ligase [Candidatus Heimdallarchaeota archaeon LC_3]|nr:MAG: Threonine--tRNA ligase [Candidatus Heimdallarchaeota archaeon LC_3]